MDIKNLHIINVEFYTGVDERLPVPVFLPPVPVAVDLSGQKILIVDDVADTGETLRMVRDFCASTWPRPAPRCCTRSRSSVVPATTCGSAPTGGSRSPGRAQPPLMGTSTDN